jgi:glucosamine--fructose-6-phosphate aminotransferase (isomerizing)
MCGIIAYLINNYQNQKKVSQVILNGLKQLQNRGYDSAGLILSNSNTSKQLSYKVASKDQNPAIEALEKDLLNSLEELNDEYLSGIGHTRWATHGGKTDLNAHPHYDQTKTLAVVHNGIIENYQELKRELQIHDYHFQSETDTEVIVQLISYYHYTEKKTLTESIQNTINRLEGTWGLAIINLRSQENHESELFLSRKGSPLLISFEKDRVFVASEESAFQNLVSEFSPLKDHDLIAISRNSTDNQFEIKFLSHSTSLENRKNKVKKDNQIQLPPHFQHWTFKEIWETPMACLRAYNNGGRILDKEHVKMGGLESIQEQLLTRKNLVMLGCGTSYHAGLLALKYFQELNHCGFETVDVIDASEFEEQQLPNVSSEKILLVHLSQSGETRDLQKCLEIGRQNNYLQIGVINVVDSLIARDVDAGCYINAGREVGVASTKSFLNQVIVLAMIAIWFSQNRDPQNITRQSRQRMIQDLRKLVLDLEKILQNSSIEIQELAKNIKETGFKSLYLLGKGNAGVALAKEGALKIKELAYYHCEGSSCSSLKHGPFGLLEENYPIVLMALGHPLSSIPKIKNSFQEIISRKARVFLVTDLKNLEDFELAYQIIKIPENSTFQELVAVVPIQLLAYYLALLEGNNPDFPRNLAKVVTVE